MTVALIDGDIVIYKCGFSVEKVHYSLPDGRTFKSKKEANCVCDSEGKNRNTLEKHLLLDSLSHCLSNTNKLLKSILKATGADDYKIFISGGNNFRHEIATIKPYKGNRDPDLKPVYKNEIEDHLFYTWNAQVIDGMEADDLLGIHQDIGTIICTTDKDLDQVPGMHYNWDSGLLYNITEEDSHYNFYKQLLMGDSTDNIRGVPGVGKKTAAIILGRCRDEEEMYWESLREYCRTHDRAFEALKENADLLFVCRANQLEWRPPV